MMEANPRSESRFEMTTPTQPKPPSAPTGQNAPANTPGKRGRKPGQMPKARPDLPANVFDISEVAEEQRVEHKRRREERSDQQKALDKLVADMYQKWIAAGRPTNWADMPIHEWTLPTTYADDAEFFLRKAASLHGRKLVFGHKVEFEKDGKKYTTLPFAVIARQQRTPRGARSDSDE